MSTSCNSSLDQKGFPPRVCFEYLKYVVIKRIEARQVWRMREAVKMNALDCLSCYVGSMRQLCCNKILLLSSPWCLDMMAGLIRFQRRSQCELLVVVVPLFVYCSTSGTCWFEKKVSIIFSADTDVCVILGALMSLNGGIICLSALFQAGSSGPSCHTHCVFPSVQQFTYLADTL